MLHTTFARVKEAGACIESYRKFARYKGGITKWGQDIPFGLDEVFEFCGLEDALWCLRSVIEPVEVEKEIRLFTCDCAQHVLPSFEDKYPSDKRPRQAIETARQFANGQATSQELEAAWSAASEAARSASGAAAWSAGASGAAASEAAGAASRAAAWSASGASGAAAWSAGAAAWSAAWSASGAAAWSAGAASEAAAWSAGAASEREWQRQRFFELINSPQV